jgi:ubiquinone/menaquinone biosynthesis C-methylase UbiE
VSGTSQQGSVYLLGSSPAEQQRLLAQAERLRTQTQRMLADVGITTGMRVLELGCGPGDVTMLLAEIVGQGGEVVGVDRDPAALAAARGRVADRGLTPVRLVEHDITALDSLDLRGAFDALVGRCILGHLDDPAGVLRAAAHFVRPGGVVAFEAPDLTLAELTIERSRLDLLKRVHGWMRRGNAAAGKELPRAGFTNHRWFVEAGLPAPRVRCLTEIGVGEGAELPSYLAGLMRSLLPLYEQLGVVTAEEVGIETLADRLYAEIRDRDPDVVLASWSFVDAWAVKAAA